MADLIVGICRFSFLGRGDWAVYAGKPHGSDEEQEARRKMAETLYRSERLEQRFRSFEALTLASIKAQRHPDFHFVVLTSTAMPQQWRERLERLCAGDGRIHLLVSDAGTVNEALLPLLSQIAENGRHRLVQFRLDDDDCLGIEYTAALHRAAEAARQYDVFAFSMPRGLLASNYAGAAPARYEIDRPFHSAGAAVRPRSPAQTIYSFGHYALMRRFPCILDPRFLGSLQLKLEGHDSRPEVPRRGNGLRLLEQPEFVENLKRAFPFVRLDELETLLA